MRPFSYSRADTVQSAVHAQMASDTPPNAATVHAPSQYLAGGTTLIDLMKLDVMRPQNVTDINALESTSAGEIEFGRAWPPPRGVGSDVNGGRSS